MLAQKCSTERTAKGPQACLQRLPRGEDLGICRQAAVRLRAAVNRAAAVPMVPHNHRAPKVRLRDERAVERQAVVLVVGKSAHTGSSAASPNQRLPRHIRGPTTPPRTHMPGEVGHQRGGGLM